MQRNKKIYSLTNAVFPSIKQDSWLADPENLTVAFSNDTSAMNHSNAWNIAWGKKLSQTPMIRQWIKSDLILITNPDQLTIQFID